MRRSPIVLLALLVCALALALSACGADPDNGRSPITTVRDETVQTGEDEVEDEGEGDEEEGDGGGKEKEKGKEKDRGKGDDSD
jgi:hypothetical protein